MNQLATTEQETQLQAPAATGEAAQMISMIERAASNPDVDIDKMERLMAMQERMLDRRAEQEYISAMTAAQADMPPIFKTAKNSHTRSSYAPLENITAVIGPIYRRHGFSVSFGESEPSHEGWIRTTMDVMHIGGHVKSYWHELPIDNVGSNGKPSKTETHGAASSSTYSQRYLYTKVFALTISGEDRDGNPPAQEVKRITPEQVKQIHAAITENDLDMEFWLGKIQNATGERSIESVTVDGFPKVWEVLQKRIKAKEAEQ